MTIECYGFEMHQKIVCLPTHTERFSIVIFWLHSRDAFLLAAEHVGVKCDRLVCRKALTRWAIVTFVCRSCVCSISSKELHRGHDFRVSGNNIFQFRALFDRKSKLAWSDISHLLSSSAPLSCLITQTSTLCWFIENCASPSQLHVLLYLGLGLCRPARDVLLALSNAHRRFSMTAYGISLEQDRVEYILFWYEIHKFDVWDGSPDQTKFIAYIRVEAHIGIQFTTFQLCWFSWIHATRGFGWMDSI